MDRVASGVWSADSRKPGVLGACRLLPGLPNVAVCSAEEEARTLEEKWHRVPRSCPRFCPHPGQQASAKPKPITAMTLHGGGHGLGHGKAPSEGPDV